MEFEWDDAKNRLNLEKHAVGFDAVRDFVWNDAIIEADIRRDYGEERFIARGFSGDGQGYHIVFTIRADKIRVISMRRFSRKDYSRYGA
ncbi:BrnT family toxin [Devosia sp. A449]